MKKILTVVTLSVALVGCGDYEKTLPASSAVTSTNLIYDDIRQLADQVVKTQMDVFKLNILENGGTIQGEFTSIEQKIATIEARLNKLEEDKGYNGDLSYVHPSRCIWYDPITSMVKVIEECYDKAHPKAYTTKELYDLRSEYAKKYPR